MRYIDKYYSLLREVEKAVIKTIANHGGSFGQTQENALRFPGSDIAIHFDGKNLRILDPSGDPYLSDIWHLDIYTVPELLHDIDTLLRHYNGTNDFKLLPDKKYYIELDDNTIIHFSTPNHLEWKYGINEDGTALYETWSELRYKNQEVDANINIEVDSLGNIITAHSYVIFYEKESDVVLWDFPELPIAYMNFDEETDN